MAAIGRVADTFRARLIVLLVLVRLLRVMRRVEAFSGASSIIVIIWYLGVVLLRLIESVSTSMNVLRWRRLPKLSVRHTVHSGEVVYEVDSGLGEAVARLHGIHLEVVLHYRIE